MEEQARKLVLLMQTDRKFAENLWSGPIWDDKSALVFIFTMDKMM
jgi:hypothetical protein